MFYLLSCCNLTLLGSSFSIRARFLLLILFIMKGSRLLALERSNQELKDSMMQIMQMMQNWNMSLPPRRRIERDLGNEFDDPGIEYELEEAQRPRR